MGGTNDLLTKQMRGAFVMLFGSYLIDWDSTDNMIRAVLAGSHGLAAMSSGRPYAHFHHMGGGYHLGFSAHQSQANNGKYTNTVRIDELWDEISPKFVLHFFLRSAHAN